MCPPPLPPYLLYVFLLSRSSFLILACVRSTNSSHIIPSVFLMPLVQCSVTHASPPPSTLLASYLSHSCRQYAPTHHARTLSTSLSVLSSLLSALTFTVTHELLILSQTCNPRAKASHKGQYTYPFGLRWNKLRCERTLRVSCILGLGMRKKTREICRGRGRPYMPGWPAADHKELMVSIEIEQEMCCTTPCPFFLLKVSCAAVEEAFNWRLRNTGIYHGQLLMKHTLISFVSSVQNLFQHFTFLTASQAIFSELFPELFTHCSHFVQLFQLGFLCRFLFRVY